MEEGTKFRVVRCPKCENLLREIPDYPVYQCGGCGAVLRAKKQKQATDGSLEKSDKEMVRRVPEKLEDSPENEGLDSSDTSETDTYSDGLIPKRGRRERFLLGKANNSNSSSSSRTENIELLNDQNGGERVETMASRDEKRSVDKDVIYRDNYRHPSKFPVANLVVSEDLDVNTNKIELAKSEMKSDIGDIKLQIGNSSGFQRRTPIVVEEARFTYPSYTDESSSNYPVISPDTGISYGYKEQIRNSSNGDGPNRVEYLNPDRAELLRKLDELKDQLSRSLNVNSKERERVPVDRHAVPPDSYGVHDNWFPEAQSRSNRASVLPLRQDKHVPKPPYFNHSHAPVSLINRHAIEMPNFYPPSIHASNEFARYGYTDPLGRQVLGKTHHQPTHQYPLQQFHDYYSGHYMDTDPEFVTSYPQNTLFHHLECSCLNCYNNQWQVPAQGPAGVYYNRRYPDVPFNPMFYPLKDPGTSGSQAYNRGTANPPPIVHSHEPNPNTRRTGDLGSEMGGLGLGHPPRVVLEKRDRCRCHPVMGGAPFITCSNCFEVLQLPKKHFLTEKKNQQKLRCGACSTIISFVVEKKRLIVLKQISLEVDEGSVEVMKEGLLHSNSCANKGRLNSSDDYDNSGYNFQSIDTEPILSSKDQCLNLTKSEKMEGLLSSSSSSSENGESLDCLNDHGEVSKSEEILSKANNTPPLPGSPLHEHIENSSDHVVSRLGKGNRSKRSYQEEVVPSRQNSIKDASMATEMEVSFNEYSNPGTSQDFGEVTSREEDQPRVVSKGSESFFESGNPYVSINGQHISDRLVKKAEKLAGPIQPGQYWYDFQAGFWGVMGKPCVGMIPPFIKEFNYPMLKNCAGGNTGVLVNGRELHQRDLDLLAARGLPTATDKSYIVKISGKVVDKDTGEELESLGKLAPTVQKEKRGFGMRGPRAAA